jgi:hypothetical protein
MTKTGKPRKQGGQQDLLKIFSQPRVHRWWSHNQWLLTGSAWLIALALGYAGFAQHAISTGQMQTPWDLLYRTLQLIPMSSGAITGPVSWEMNVARLLIPFLTAFTAVQAFVALFQQHANLIRLKFMRNHLVICGLSHKGLLLTNSFRNRGDQVVVIEKNGSNPLLEQCRMHGAIVLMGNATDRDILSKAAVSRAKAVIAVSESDGVNTEIALTVREMSRERTGSVLTCIVHIVDPQLYTLFREREIEMEAGSTFRLELFNVYSRGAILLLSDLPYFSAIEKRDRYHMVVIGLGMMGESLVANAVRLWHDDHAQANKSLQITVVDREAIKKCNSLSVRYLRLKDYCEFIACQMDIQDVEFQSGHFLSSSQDLAEVDCFCVCLDDDSLGIYTGLVLLQLTRAYGIPIIVRVSKIAGLARFLNECHESHSTFKHLFAFGLLERTCTPDLLLRGTHEILAQTIHEEYILRQRQHIKDVHHADSILPWEMLPEHLKESNRQQADRIGLKLNSIGYMIAPLTDWEAVSFEFTPEEIELMAQMEHEDWTKQLKSEGWTYSPMVKNPDKKTHPDLVSWVELTETEKEKNRSTVQEIPRFLARAGFQVEWYQRISK